MTRMPVQDGRTQHYFDLGRWWLAVLHVHARSVMFTGGRPGWFVASLRIAREPRWTRDFRLVRAGRTSR